MYAMATVIREMLGYKMNNTSQKDPAWRRRPEAKIKATQSEVSRLPELQIGVGKTMIPKKYYKMSIPESLEIAKF